MSDIAELDAEKAAAKAAKLHYVTDKKPGIARKLEGDHFVFFAPDGSRIEDEATIARIRKMAIPPAYTDVWICKDRNGHLQATGRDARGRKHTAIIRAGAWCATRRSTAACWCSAACCRPSAPRSRATWRFQACRAAA